MGHPHLLSDIVRDARHIAQNRRPAYSVHILCKLLEESTEPKHSAVSMEFNYSLLGNGVNGHWYTPLYGPNDKIDNLFVARKSMLSMIKHRHR